MSYSMPRTILDCIGDTPLLGLQIEHEGEQWNISAKCEFLNPSGSVKDRIARYMIERAEERGLLGPGSVVVEGTSGNTGIGLSLVAAVKGYPVIIVMPENMTGERVRILEHLGARICLSPAEESFEGAVERVRMLLDSDERLITTDQFGNEDNVSCHYETTGQEILRQSHGPIDAFVAGIGTGGTLMGVAMALREVSPDIEIVAVEPDESAVLSGDDNIREHPIAGIGDGFIPDIVDQRAIDWVERVPGDDAVQLAKKLARTHGLLVGVSSGANILAAIATQKRLGKGANVVTVLPDRAERYFSTELFWKGPRRKTRRCEECGECVYVEISDDEGVA